MSHKKIIGKSKNLRVEEVLKTMLSTPPPKKKKTKKRRAKK